MAFLEIKKLGCPTLRKKADAVDAVNDDIRQLVDDMFETMYAAEGIGLAAPQVGLATRVVVLDVSPLDPSAMKMALINPEITWVDGEIIREEGCLSLPGVAGDVKRASRIGVQALDREGKLAEWELSDIAARATQHEVDHLNGILVTDHFSSIKRNLLRGQLRKLKREGSRQTPGLLYLDEVIPTED